MIKKIIWFIPKPTVADKVIATENKMVIRDSNAGGENDFIERCDAVCGDVPKRYEHLPKVDAPKAYVDLHGSKKQSGATDEQKALNAAQKALDSATKKHDALKAKADSSKKDADVKKATDAESEVVKLQLALDEAQKAVNPV